MIAQAFAYAVAVALLIGLAAASVERCLSDLARPRRIAWTFAYAIALLLPLASLLLAADAPAPPPIGSASLNASAVYAQIDWDAALVSLWAATTISLLAYYAAAWLRLAWLAKRWTQVPGATPLLIADDVGPAVLGIRRPRIVLPRWLMEAPAAVRRTVVAHELEHIAARDQALIVAAHFVTILLPWNLPLWWFARRLRSAIEIDCDARVVRTGVDPAHYAQVLLAVGQRRTFSPFAAATLIEPVTHLERRIRIMLMRPTRVPKTRAAFALVLAIGFGACTTQLEAPPLAASPEATGVVIRSNGIEIASRTIDVRGPGVALAPGVTTLLSGDIVLRTTDSAAFGAARSQLVTSSRLTKTDDGVLLEGDVRFVIDRMSITTPRALVRTAADGVTRVEMDSAALTYLE